ncbi:MAG: hypothetical protein NZ601_00180 [candidate division WOR-3 bacterium]|nr:hypothetical protein [candidate division WOR-3 bacterium]MCX7757302.1 hypothetical protein [candidate division WOR-3 bacterium]MDW7987989.1 hypothetical protein [candidate division WOR-3 bacterium]
MRNQLPLIIVFATGLLVIVTFFIPHEPFGSLEQRFLVWYSIVAGFTMLLGLDSLVRYHLIKIRDRRSGWGYSLVLLSGLFVTLILGFYSWARYQSPFKLGSPFMYLYSYVIIPLQATMFALLAFFIASAAYRAFRARTTAATLLLVSAVLVMLGRVPLGGWLWQKIVSLIDLLPGTNLSGLKGLEVFARISDWIMDVPQTAAKRGIYIGIVLGGIAMSLRIILGIERSYTSGS